MVQRRLTAQRPFRILVANQSQGSYPDLGINISDPGVRLRRSWRFQNISHTGVGTADAVGAAMALSQGGAGVGNPARATATITVDDNDFTDGAVVRIGPYEITIPGDVTPGAGVNATATALALAITALPGYNAVAVLDDVNIQGRKGIQGNEDTFEAQSFGVVDNLTLVPVMGKFGGATPEIDAATFTTT